MVTLAAPDRLVAHDSEAGHACVHTISSISSHQYGVIYVPDAAAANVVHVNGVLFVPADCPRSKAILTEALVKYAAHLLLSLFNARVVFRTRRFTPSSTLTAPRRARSTARLVVLLFFSQS